jgi:hypothetical protein
MKQAWKSATKLAAFALALAAPLLLASCVLSPGKFTSTLDIRKDRSFTFAYVGEVIMLDPKNSLNSGGSSLTEDSEGNGATPAKPAVPTAEEAAQTLAERKAVAEALSKETGYRSVEYLGGDKFRVDYLTTGKLDRGFVYPINVDAKAVIPWIAIEVRKDNTVRVKALAFGDSSEGMGSFAKPGSPDTARDGTFTLTTDAQLVMQNNEAGPAPGPGTKIVWRVNAGTITVPTAVIRF